MPATDKVQLNLRVNVELAARLENLSAMFGQRGRTQVAETILELCIDFYEHAEEEKKAAFRRSLNNSLAGDE